MSILHIAAALLGALAVLSVLGWLVIKAVFVYREYMDILKDEEWD